MMTSNMAKLRFSVDLLNEILFLASIFSPLLVQAATDAADVQGLQSLYTSLSSPSLLTNWKSSGGDPCVESWKGVTCQGSAITSIQLSGLGLSGTMGYALASLVSLRTFDLSNNNIHDQIPYQLPPNLTSLNLAGNNLSGNLPYSISLMVSLSNLNTSRNSLSMSIGDLFANLVKLEAMDLSFNNFSGDLPTSFTSLTNLSTLFLGNYQQNSVARLSIHTHQFPRENRDPICVGITNDISPTPAFIGLLFDTPSVY